MGRRAGSAAGGGELTAAGARRAARRRRTGGRAVVAAAEAAGLVASVERVRAQAQLLDFSLRFAAAADGGGLPVEAATTVGEELAAVCRAAAAAGDDPVVVGAIVRPCAAGWWGLAALCRPPALDAEALIVAHPSGEWASTFDAALDALVAGWPASAGAAPDRPPTPDRREPAYARADAALARLVVHGALRSLEAAGNTRSSDAVRQGNAALALALGRRNAGLAPAFALVRAWQRIDPATPMVRAGLLAAMAQAVDRAIATAGSPGDRAAALPAERALLAAIRTWIAGLRAERDPLGPSPD